VARGALLIQSEDPELVARLAVLQAELTGLQARLVAAQASNRVQADILLNQIAHATVALNLAQSHLTDLNVRSPGGGTFEMGDVQNAPGRFVQRGELLAYVTNRAPTIVRVVVPQSAADDVRQGTLNVVVRPVAAPGQVFAARLLRVVPGATQQLPSLVLSLEGGGKIGLDPNQPGDAKAIERLFVLDVQLQDGVVIDQVGSRVYVRFEHDPEPIGTQWMKTVKRVFLKKLNV
jgi:putative peptide zinc metalloprotease protein